MKQVEIIKVSAVAAGLLASPIVAWATPQPCGAAISPPPPACSGTGAQSCAINFNGLLRTYNLYVPSTYSPGQAVPFMFVLHGRMGNGPLMEATTQFDKVAEANGFIAVYPTACSGDWQLTDGSDVEFLGQVLQTTTASYTLDPKRTYLSGFSEGGELATLYTCTASNNPNVAGLAVVSTDLDSATETFCSAAAPVTYVLFHGISDPISYYLGGAVHQGQVGLSAPATARFWENQDQCVSADTYGPIVTNDQLNDGDPSTDELYGNNMCANGTTVHFYTIGPLPVHVAKPVACKTANNGGPPLNGGGHTWPGSSSKTENQCVGPVSQELNASGLIWTILSPHSSP